jgi:hypothetical protein
LTGGWARWEAILVKRHSAEAYRCMYWELFCAYLQKIMPVTMPVLYVSWSLLNLVLFVGLFIYGRVLLKRYRLVSLGVSIVFVVLIVSYFSGRNTSARKSIVNFQTTVLLPGVAYPKPLYTQLDDLQTLTIQQIITLTPNRQSDSVQVSSSSYLTGFVAGFKWSPTHALVDALANRKLRYVTSGVLEWKLLGLTVYKQPKQFNGRLTL